MVGGVGIGNKGIVTGNIPYQRRVTHQREAVGGGIECAHVTVVDVIAVFVGGQPLDAGDIEVALLAAWRKFNLTGEGIAAAAVVHGQHILLDVGELFDNRLDVDGHLDGANLHTVLGILHQFEDDFAGEGGGEGAVVGEVEPHGGFHLFTAGKVDFGRAVGITGVDACVARNYQVGMSRRRVVDTFAAGHHIVALIDVEVLARHHGQSEGVGGVGVDGFDTVQVFFQTQCCRTPCTAFVDGLSGVGVVFGCKGCQIAGDVRCEGRVGQNDFAVAASQQEAVVCQFVVVAVRSGRQFEHCLGDGQSGHVWVVGITRGDGHRLVLRALDGTGVGDDGGLALTQTLLVAGSPHTETFSFVVGVGVF